MLGRQKPGHSAKPPAGSPGTTSEKLDLALTPMYREN